MARRKAEELEDFEGRKELPDLSEREVEEGSAKLKELLREWKQEVQGRGLSQKEQAEELRRLAKGRYREALETPFFKSVMAL